jgi:hypothetical protein
MRRVRNTDNGKGTGWAGVTCRLRRGIDTLLDGKIPRSNRRKQMVGSNDRNPWHTTPSREMVNDVSRISQRAYALLACDIGSESSSSGRKTVSKPIMGRNEHTP